MSKTVLNEIKCNVVNKNSIFVQKKKTHLLSKREIRLQQCDRVWQTLTRSYLISTVSQKSAAFVAQISKMCAVSNDWAACKLL